MHVLQDTATFWSVLKSSAQAILGHPYVQTFGGSEEYLKAVVSLCNWGVEVTKSAVDHAELLRGTIQRLYLQRSKLMQTVRYSNLVEELKSETASVLDVTLAIREQLQDVRRDVNNVLMSFCQVTSNT